MQFRRNIIRNVHYLAKLPDEIINEIIAHLEVKRFAKDSIILKSGDVSDRLNFIRHGEVNVIVQSPTKNADGEQEELLFDTLNSGSCFCAYTFISDDAQQLQMFKAKSNCIVESIGREDFFNLAKKYYQLADQLELINEKFDENETDFDFFRYRMKRRLPQEVRLLVRKKFRVALCKFLRKYKNGEAEIPRALTMIKEF